MVAIYDLAKREWMRWYPSPDPAHRGRDVHHFNTIKVIGGQVCLLAHKFGRSELFFYEYPRLSLNSVVPLGVKSHDLFFFDGMLATCSSGEGCIVSLSGQRFRTFGFPRGVETAPEGNLLGISMICPRDQRQLQDGILRWYAPDWRFRADYLVPRVGMVLAALDLGRQEATPYSIELWQHAEITHGTYNRLVPGNLYLPNAFFSEEPTPGWHSSEVSHRWTAAKEAALSILINPGDQRLRVEISSANPKPYWVELWLDDQPLETVAFPHPTSQNREFYIPGLSCGPHSLIFRVPYLWKPTDFDPDSHDDRLLGVAVHRVTLD